MLKMKKGMHATAAVLLAALALCSGALFCEATRMSSGQGYDLRGSYFGTFEKQDHAKEDAAFVIPTKRDPTTTTTTTEEAKAKSGTAVMCVCSSAAMPHNDHKIEFAVDGVVAFLQNDKIGQKYPLDGVIRCPMPSGKGKVQGASSHSLCHYVKADDDDDNTNSNYDITLELDAAKSLQDDNGAQSSSSHVAFFNISHSNGEGEGSSGSVYSGYIGSKLSALDSVCDDIACRKSPVVKYNIVKEVQEEEEKAEEGGKKPQTTRPQVPTTPVIAVVDDSNSQEEEEEEHSSSSSLYSAGRDGSVARNAVGQLRCGGKSSASGSTDLKPACGDQGYCMDEVTGQACYWDCQPGWCSCTAGTCFDQDGKCTVQATYPASNNYQATCSSVKRREQSSSKKKQKSEEMETETETTNTVKSVVVVDQDENEDEQGKVSFDSGRDGARPMNYLKSLRCGGDSDKGGKPSCGNMGFCLDEVTGERCFWDCDPGWCSCNSGACFDSFGRCTESATYPESNNWQASCDVGVLTESSRREKGADEGVSATTYIAGKDGARPPNHLGNKRCGGTKGEPDCGIQGYCMDELTGDGCYWDCNPGWCSCTSGACFDQDGKCTLPASYPQANNWQATCPTQTSSSDDWLRNNGQNN
jgi:hypothetical protein